MNKILSLLTSFIVCLVFSTAVVAQKESLGAVKYTPPKGWTKTQNENAVIFSEINQTTGKFCLITLYGVTVSSGAPERDFAGTWNDRVEKILGAEANPETQAVTAEGWTLTVGGSQIDFQGNKALAFLSVLSGYGRSVSILGILSDNTYLPQLQAFVKSIEVDKSAAMLTPPVIKPALPETQALAGAEPMHAAALVKEFESNEINAIETYRGKRVRIKGTVNSIEIDREGRIVLTFKSSVSTYSHARCYFPGSQSSRVGALKAHEEATVEGTVRGLGDGFGNTKAFLVLENCLVP